MDTGRTEQQSQATNLSQMRTELTEVDSADLHNSTLVQLSKLCTTLEALIASDHVSKAMRPALYSQPTEEAEPPPEVAVQHAAEGDQASTAQQVESTTSVSQRLRT